MKNVRSEFAKALNWVRPRVARTWGGAKKLTGIKRWLSPKIRVAQKEVAKKPKTLVIFGFIALFLYSLWDVSSNQSETVLSGQVSMVMKWIAIVLVVLVILTALPSTNSKTTSKAWWWIGGVVALVVLAFLGWRYLPSIGSISVPNASITPISVILGMAILASFLCWKGGDWRKRGMSILASIGGIAVVVFMVYMFHPDMATTMLNSKLFWNSACGIVIIAAIATINSGVAILATIGLAVLVLPQVGFELPDSSATIPTRKPSPEYSEWVRQNSATSVVIEAPIEGYSAPVNVSDRSASIGRYGEIDVVVDGDFANPIKFRNDGSHKNLGRADYLQFHSVEDEPVKVKIYFDNH